MSRVIALPRRRQTPKPAPVIRESVTAEERAAVDALLRAAQALHRTYSATWATPAALARTQGLVAEAETALAEFKELVCNA